MLDTVFDSIKSAVGGGKKGERTRALTTLGTDQLISNLTKTIPLLLLAFMLYFNSELFSSNSIKCEPRVFKDPDYSLKNGQEPPEIDHYSQTAYAQYTLYRSDMANRFYHNQYCWDRLTHVHYRNNGSVKVETSLQKHKYFPYFILFIVAVASVPSIIWTGFARRKIQPQVETFISSIIEALNLTVEELANVLRESKEDTSENDVFGIWFMFRQVGSVNVLGRNRYGEGAMETAVGETKTPDEFFEMLRQKIHRPENRERLDMKFKVFEEFMAKAAKSLDLFKYFVIYRLANIAAISACTAGLYWFSLIEKQDRFSCEVMYPHTPGLMASEMIACSINGVDIRHFATKILIGSLIILAVVAVVKTVFEMTSIARAHQLLYMCDQVFDVDEHIRNKRGRFSDLAVLLNLVDGNIKSNSKIVKMCTTAWEIAEVSAKNVTNIVAVSDKTVTNTKKLKGRDASIAKRNNYLIYLSSLVAINIQEDGDADVENIVNKMKSD